MLGQYDARVKGNDRDRIYMIKGKEKLERMMRNHGSEAEINLDDQY
jgi:hypothetical protein